MLQEYYMLLKKKNTQTKHPVKFGINVTGFQGINCNSYMEVNTKNNAFHFVITLCHYRIENMTNRLGKQLIKDAINNENLSDEKIKKYLSSKSLNEMDLINKINDELFQTNFHRKNSKDLQERRQQQFKKNRV